MRYFELHFRFPMNDQSELRLGQFEGNRSWRRLIGAMREEEKARRSNNEDDECGSEEDSRGNEIPISDLWKDRKAVVAFARHFGCVLCRKRAAYLAEKKDVMDASGVTLVLIGPGSIDQAKTFVEQTKFEGEVYADPNHASYEALKFASGVSVTFTPKAAMKIIESYMEGYRQDWKLSFMKDTVERGGWQQGGILVAGPGKDNISYIRKDKEAGDDPPVEEILKACCA